jgi:hypothetical protein
MKLGKLIFVGIVIGASAVGTGSLSAQLKQEPPAGSISCGNVVLVDDGTCGKGKIKRVVGGCNISYGRRADQAKRTSRCVNR